MTISEPKWHPMTSNRRVGLDLGASISYYVDLQSPSPSRGSSVQLVPNNTTDITDTSRDVRIPRLTRNLDHFRKERFLPLRYTYAGRRLTAAALLIYGLSAVLSSASAGLLVADLGFSPPGDSGIGILAVTGNLLLVLGIALAVVSLLILILAFWRLIGEFLKVASNRVKLTVVAITMGLWAVAFILLAVGAILLGRAALVFIKIPPGTAFEDLTAINGATALVFLGALSLPVVAFGRRMVRTLGLLAVILGGVGVLGETLITQLRPAVTPDWLTFGGYPLINWNLPFGALVASSALLLWHAYRSVMST